MRPSQMFILEEARRKARIDEARGNHRSIANLTHIGLHRKRNKGRIPKKGGGGRRRRG